VVVGSNGVSCVGGVGGLEGHVAACVDDGGVDVFLHTGGEGGLDGIGFSGMGFRWRGIMRKNASMVGWETEQRPTFRHVYVELQMFPVADLEDRFTGVTAALAWTNDSIYCRPSLVEMALDVQYLSLPTICIARGDACIPTPQRYAKSTK